MPAMSKLVLQMEQGRWPAHLASSVDMEFLKALASRPDTTTPGIAQGRLHSFVKFPLHMSDILPRLLFTGE
eukprot:450755-Pelagomonas_calceolata.AAC.13